MLDWIERPHATSAAPTGGAYILVGLSGGAHRHIVQSVNMCIANNTTDTNYNTVLPWLALHGLIILLYFATASDNQCGFSLSRIL